MQLIDIILILYILLVVIGLVLLWQKLADTLFNIPNLTPEQRILIIVAVYAIITFAAFYVGLKINAKRNAPTPVNPVQTQAVPIASPSNTQANPPPNLSAPPTATPSNTTTPTNTIPALVQTNQDTVNPSSELQNFLELNYFDFEQQRSALQQTLQRLDQFFKRADQLAANTPTHRRFMQQIALNRWNFRQQLESLRQEIEQETQTFWIFYRAGSSEHTEQAFTKKTVSLTEDIQTLLGKESDVLTKENKLIKSYIQYLTKMLNRPAPKPNQNSPQYTPQNRQFVLKWLQAQRQIVLLNNLTALEESKKRIETSLYEFQRFLTQYPTMENRLQSTLSLWKQALQANLYVQYRLLHCAEAELLLTDPEMKIAPETGQALNSLLIDRLPLMISEAADIRLQAERSYATERNKNTR
ncbi:MAG: hypothetical protein WAQ53_11785 [Thiofilum sp.]|uniref:hypothetical protein n=1 Tax=Thiofilum sp. TaxID=2212733 RepID=UPI0025F53361|nr:hypothetical protein [Thiofilum sp.]MBK8452564.1 hypothetical protein [Thiofilum sp.]